MSSGNKTRWRYATKCHRFIIRFLKFDNSQHVPSATTFETEVVLATDRDADPSGNSPPARNMQLVPLATRPCLLTAKGRHDSVFHACVEGSKDSTDRSTTLSSSPPTRMITSTRPAIRNGRNWNLGEVMRFHIPCLIPFPLLPPNILVFTDLSIKCATEI